jgi:menaquinone-dependent protoporphyrinogen oxidase
VSEAIGKTLSEFGENVDVLPMNDIRDISNYKAVIAGSAIQAGKWLPEAMDFIKTYRYDLSQKPFAAFLVCMTLAMPKGESYRDHVSSWLQPVRNLVKPINEGLFSGTLYINKVPSFSDRFKFRISTMVGVWKEGDHRNWEEIKTWTKNTRLLLTNQH